MHTYQRPLATPEPPSDIDDFLFNDALDVVAFAELNPCIGKLTWPEAWHLDETGAFQCYFKGSSLDSLLEWAEDPWPLERSRREGLANGGCADRWVIVDSRPRWHAVAPDEDDVRAFLDLRLHLRDALGVELVDVVVFDDEGHWWSLHELTCGTTAWAPPNQHP